MTGHRLSRARQAGVLILIGIITVFMVASRTRVNCFKPPSFGKIVSEAKIHPPLSLSETVAVFDTPKNIEPLIASYADFGISPFSKLGQRHGRTCSLCDLEMRRYEQITVAFRPLKSLQTSASAKYCTDIPCDIPRRQISNITEAHVTRHIVAARWVGTNAKWHDCNVSALQNTAIVILTVVNTDQNERKSREKDCSEASDRPSIFVSKLSETISISNRDRENGDTFFRGLGVLLCLALIYACLKMW